MHAPLSDNLTPGERESVPERQSPVTVEREVPLEGGAPLPSEVIRARIEGGFYHTPAVAEVVARRIVAGGDLG
jgi:hypothetical protein